MAIQMHISTNPSLSRLSRAFKGYQSILEKFIDQSLTAIAFEIEGQSKRVTPVDTGRLRSSIGVSSSISDRGRTKIIGTHVSYAIYVHEGTRFMRSQPFMEQGVKATMPKAEGIVQFYIERSLDELKRSI